MKTIILQLLNEISALTPPVNPLILKQLFEKYPYGDGGPNTELVEHVNILKRLKELTEEHLKYSGDLNTMQSKINHFDRLSLHNQSLVSQIKESQERITQLKEKLLPSYKEIELKANNFLLAKNPLATVHSATQIDEMHKIVAEFDKELVALCKDIDARKAKSKLVLLKDTFDTLISSLKALDVDCSYETSADQLQEITSSISSNITKLTKQLDKSAVLQKGFARQLSVDELNHKVDELKSHNDQFDEDLQSIELEITNHPLDKQIQSRLIQEYDDSKDQSVLIESYKSKIDSAWSYVNPLAWASWGLDAITLKLDKQKHNEEQLEYTNCVQFLELLEKKRDLKSQQNDNLANQQLLNGVLPHAISTEETADQLNLIPDTIRLFNSLPTYTSTIELDEQSSATDFYLTLLLNMPLIAEKLEKMNVAHSKLKQLAPLYKEIEQLRTEYDLDVAQDNLLPGLEEAKQIDSTLTLEAPLRIDYQNQIELCKSYLQGAEELTTHIMENTELRATQKALAVQLRAPENKPPKRRELDSISSHLATLLETIVLKLRQLSQLKISESTSAHILDIPENKPNIPVSENLLADSVLDIKPVLSDVLQASTKEPNKTRVSIVTSEPDVQRELTVDPVPPSQDKHDFSVALPDDYTSSSDSDTSDKDLKSISDSESSSFRDDETDGDKNVPLTPANTLGVAQPALSSNRSILTEEHYSEDEDDFSESSTEQSEILSEEDPTKLNPELKDDLDTSSKPLAINSNSDDFLNSLDQIIPDVDQLTSSTSSEYTISQSSENEESNTDNPSAIVSQNYLNIQKWHKENLGYLSKCPEDIQHWYKEVHGATKSLLEDESYCYKVSHLIRDILFELEHKKDHDVIRAYMRLCPNPAQDINKLLALKPSLLITDDSYDESNELMDCPVELKQHYEHYNKLKKDYPIEAELFLQAVRSVHMVKLYANLPNHKITMDQIPSLSTDPRYEPLKRHRGFLKVWEFLEDLCRLIIGKIKGQPEYEYEKRPCFFNTKSNKLIKEADCLIQDLLPTNTA